MKLYVLKGVYESGKTTILNILIQELEKKYSITDNEKKVINKGPDEDQQVVFYNLNGHKVGIETIGDPNSRLKESLEEFKKLKCDIIFCACRTRGTTVAIVENFSRNYSYSLDITLKTREENTRNLKSTDKAFANMMIEKAGL